MLELSLRTAGWVLLHLQERANIASLEERGGYVILCLGESTTFNSYPRFLEIVLNEKCGGLNISVIDKGVPGIHTTHILALLEGYLDAYQPDLVIAMMGINDGEDTQAFVRPPENDRASSGARPRPESSSSFLADLRVCKLARLLYQRAKNTLTEIDHRSDFIKEFESSVETEVSAAGIKDPGDWIIQSSPLNRDGGYFLRLGDEYAEQEQMEKAAAAYKKAAALETDNIELLRDLAGRVRDLEGYPEAEAVYRRILEIDPKDYLAYVELGILARDQDRPDDARDYFRKARETKPGLTGELLRIARSHRDRGDDGMMERYCRMAIEADPDNYAGYSELGLLCVWLNRREDARRMLRKAIELNPRDADAYARMGIIYERESRPEEAKQMYRRALDINPGVWDAAYNLIMIYQREGKLDKAEALYRRMTEVSPKNYRTWGALAVFYDSQGKEDLAGTYFEKESKLRSKSLNPTTATNYRILRDILKERGIPMVAMQYPMRSLQELRDVFDDDAGVAFIDNEDVFKDAVRRDGYQAYFCDHFAGDFGHCSPRGNRLLAENIADSLVSLNLFSHHSRERTDYEFN